MEPNQTTAPRGRRSRRPSTNLNLSSISPLTTAELTAGNCEANGDDVRSSYLQSSSAPSTPGILSRSSSAHRAYRSFAALPLTSLTPYNSNDGAPITKSKSSSYLVNGGRSRSSHHRRQKSATGNVRDSSEWLSRTGAAVSEEARVSKGQSWLTSRASSTSLVDDSDNDNVENNSSNSKRKRRTVSGNRRYAEQDLDALRGVAREVQEPAFIDDIFQGDDFADEGGEWEDDEDDEELHWSAASGSVFGAWVDRIMGFSLFDVDEEDEEEYAVVVNSNNGSRGNGNGNGRGRKRLVRGQQIMREMTTEVKVEPKEREDEGWQDAAWLFAIATKAFL